MYFGACLLRNRVISFVFEYHYDPSVRHLATHPMYFTWSKKTKKIIHVHHSEKHSMEQVVYTFWDKNYNCFVAIKGDFVFSSIITQTFRR